MKTVAIISEYNPFHSGHKYQIDKIREEFGFDTLIVSVMSGNFTQRAEVAFAPKNVRATAAVKAGVNLVLELPFPFSSASAEFFAKSGVKIAEAVGADYLSFGSESGDIELLKSVAGIMQSSEFINAFQALNNDKSLGYPERCERAYKMISSHPFEFTSNNILALEYIKAINELGASIKPHTIKRFGAEYDSQGLQIQPHQSAMALRNSLSKADFSVMEYLPKETRDTVLSAYNNGELPCDFSKLSSAFISFLRLNPPTQESNIHDAGGGLYNRLHNTSFEATDIYELLMHTETKKYTKARIRRALLNVFFGVTSSELNTLPQYTQILAMDNLGMQILKKKRKLSDFQILTKPSDFKAFDEVALRQKQLSDKADSIFELTKPIPRAGASWLTFTPYVKK